MPDDILDIELIERCASQNDECAWEMFVRKYSRLIWSAIHKTFLSTHYPYTPEDAEDLFHGVFVSLIDNDFKKLRQFRSRNACTLSTWLTVVAVNQTIDFMRRETKRFHVSIDDAQVSGSALTDQGQDIESILMERQFTSAIKKALPGLPETDRQVYELLFVQGLVPEEAAANLGISLSTLYTRKHRLINKLKIITLTM